MQIIITGGAGFIEYRISITLIKSKLTIDVLLGSLIDNPCVLQPVFAAGENDYFIHQYKMYTK
jgi:hypothetical protein